jgi:S-adenosylmethionine hydrolase
MSIITLLTDFGTRDEYVGVMKGVILSITPLVTIVDISHGVPPQDISRAAYLLEGYHCYFPPGTIHVVVVDPGVGGSRSILAVKTEQYTYLVPDNGVLERIVDELQPQTVVRVENREIFLADVSRTFHGRDIFAPVAARLAQGMDAAELGSTVVWPDIVRLDVPRAVVTASGRIEGSVITFDRFGNAVTSIRRDHLEQLASRCGCREIEVWSAGRCIAGLSQSYEAAPVSKPLAIIGSRGYLEIGLNRGSAKEALDLSVGDPVAVRGVPPGSRPCEST